MAPAVKRVRNISISRPIIYGNTATPFDPITKPTSIPTDHTHSWTIFVGDPTKVNDLSTIIKKVQFKLHDTIRNPLRVIENPPYEITETGWGEFEVIIKIFFKDESNEKPVQFYHHLKLHPYGPNVSSAASSEEGTVTGDGNESLINTTATTTTTASLNNSSNGGIVESILYDELLFNEPTEPFFKLLTDKPGHLLYSKKTRDNSNVSGVFSDELEQEELFRISQALETVQEQILISRKKIQELDYINKQNGEVKES